MATEKKLTKKDLKQLKKKLKKKLSIEEDPFNDILLKKRQQNLKISKNYPIDEKLTKTDDVEDIVKIRKKYPDNYKEWKVKKKNVYGKKKGLKIAALRPGKEAHEKYKANSYYGYGENGKSTATKKEPAKCNKHDFLPVILDKNKNIARRVEYQTHQAWRNTLKKDDLIDFCEKDGMIPYFEKATLIKNIIKRAKTEATLLKLSGRRSSKWKNAELEEFAKKRLAAKDDLKIRKMADIHLPRDSRYKTAPDLKKIEFKNPDPKINRYTPWTLEHLASGLEKLKYTDEGKVALEIIGSLLVRMAYMLDHEQENAKGLCELQIPPEALKALKKLLPKGRLIVVRNKVKEDDESKDEDEDDYIDVDALLYLDRKSVV